MKTRFILTAILVALAGCSEDASAPVRPAPELREVKPETVAVPVKPLNDVRDGFTDIELTIQAPSEPIEGYVIRWGTSPDSLDQMQRITVDELTKSPNSEGPQTYIYVLREVKNSEKLFVSVAPYQNGSISKESAPFEVR